MTDESEPRDTFRDVFAMLTLIVESEPWPIDEDEQLLHEIWEESLSSFDNREEGWEYLLLAALNTTRYALIWLAEATGRSETYWLQQIALMDRETGNAD